MGSGAEVRSTIVTNRVSKHLNAHGIFYATILPVAIVARLIFLNAHGFWFDEGNSIQLARRFLEPGLFTRGTAGPESPLWIGLLWLWLGLNETELWLKLLPAALSILSVAAAYFAVHRFFGSLGHALYVALLVALSPFCVYYARELRTFSLYALTGFTCFYYFTRLLENEKDRTANIGYVLAATATFYAHYFGALWVAAIGLSYLLVSLRIRRRITRWLALHTVSAVLCIPGMWFALVASRYTDHSKWGVAKPTAKSLLITIKNFMVGFTALRPLYVAALLVAVVLVAAAAVRLLRARMYKKLAVLTLTASIPALLCALSMFDRAPYFDRYVIPAALPVYMMVCIGALGTRPPRSATSVTVAAVAAILPVSVMLAGLPAIWFDNLHPATHHRPGIRYKIDNRALASYIADHWQPGDLVAHASHVTIPPMRYYLPERYGKYVVLTEDDIRGHVASYNMEEAFVKLGTYPEQIQQYLYRPEHESARLWMVVSWWEPFAREDPAERVLAWCDAHLQLVDHAAFRGIDLYLYATDRSAAWRRIARVVDGVEPVDVYPERETPVLPASPLPEPPEQQGGWSSSTTVYFDGVDREHLKCVVRPETPGSRTYEYTVYETAYMVEAVSFSKRKPESDVWRINTEYNPAPPPPFFPNACLSVALDTNPPAADDSVKREIEVGPGRYSVFVHGFFDGLPENQYRANLHIAVADQKLPRLNFNFPDRDPGWYWVRAGYITLTGRRSVEITMHASNMDNLPAAYLDVDKLALVAEDENVEDGRVPEPANPPVAAAGTVTATQESPATVTVKNGPWDKQAGQIDVFVVDSSTGHEYRLFMRRAIVESTG